MPSDAAMHGASADLESRISPTPDTLATATSPSPIATPRSKTALAGAGLDAPVPMHLPAILVNPRVRHLQSRHDLSTPPKSRSDAAQTQVGRPMGRRKTLRSENARMLSNNVKPSLRDFHLSHPNPAKATLFPPGSQGGSLKPPSTSSVVASAPAFDAASAQCGQFTLGIREANRILGEKLGVKVGPRRRGDGYPHNDLSPAQQLIVIAERELVAWLDPAVYVVSDRSKSSAPARSRTIVTADFQLPSSDDATPDDVETAQLVETSRQPHALVWSIPDSFLRLTIHCLARVYGCPSFSKEGSQPGQRHTWILNPNPLARASRRRMSRQQNGANGGDSENEHAAAAMASAAESSSSSASILLPRGRMNAARSEAALGTPPTTDVGTDIDTESVLWESESEMAASLILAEGGGEQEREDAQADLTFVGQPLQGLSRLDEEHEGEPSCARRGQEGWEDADDAEWEADLDSDAASTSELGDSLSGSVHDALE